MWDISMMIIEIQQVRSFTRKNSALTTSAYRLVLKSATCLSCFSMEGMKSNFLSSTKRRHLMTEIKSIKYPVGSVIARKVFNMDYWQEFSFQKALISSLNITL